MNSFICRSPINKFKVAHASIYKQV